MEKPLSLAAAIQRQKQGEPPPADAGIFGANTVLAECGLVLLPVPWDATASYGKGTARGPAAMVAASHQMDLEDPEYGSVYEFGIGYDQDCHDRIWQHQRQAEGQSAAVINQLSRQVNDEVYRRAQSHLNAGRKVAVVGGEHSAPFGLLKALNEQVEEFGVLHIDAHFDLRDTYEGFEYSHASIMFNVWRQCDHLTHMVQVGIRDYAKAEQLYQQKLGPKSRVLYDRDLQLMKCRGQSYCEVLAELIAGLPRNVYISFDIDGLDPALCPSTGTPVPGGLTFGEVQALLSQLWHSGRNILGFDLSEVAPDSQTPDDEWDANVGVRLLYLLAGVTLRPAP